MSIPVSGLEDVYGHVGKQSRAPSDRPEAQDQDFEPEVIQRIRTI